MDLGVNVPTFGPGTDPGILRSWAGTVEDLGYDLLMVSAIRRAVRLGDAWHPLRFTMDWLHDAVAEVATAYRRTQA